MSTLEYYDLDIDIEGELIGILSSLPQEGTNEEGEQNDYYQDSSIIDSLIYESIEDPHFLVNNYCDLDFDQNSEEEENFENNTTSSERQSCHHYMVEEQEHTCKGDRETKSKLLNIFPYLMSDNNEELKEEQSHDDDTVVSGLDQEHYNGDPCPNRIDRILHPILNQDLLGTDIVSNLEIIPRIKLKTFPSHQIPRSIIPSHLGENFQSTLSSQLF